MHERHHLSNLHPRPLFRLLIASSWMLALLGLHDEANSRRLPPWCQERTGRPREDLGVTAWQFAGGITHMSTYTIQDQLAPADYAAFADFAGRLAFCRRGKPVVDVAVLIPERSIWAAYNPPDGGRFRRYLARNPEALRIDEAFRLTAHELLHNQRDFEFVSEDLLSSATLEKGSLALADERFPFLFLPEVRIIRTGTIEKVRAFVQADGRVVFVGNLPWQTAEHGDDPAVTRAARALIEAHPGRVVHIKSTGDLGRMIERMREQAPPLTWNGPRGVRILHRREPGREILLIANPAKQKAAGSLALPASGNVYLWNPETGAAQPLSARMAGDLLNVAVPGESARIVTIE